MPADAQPPRRQASYPHAPHSAVKTSLLIPFLATATVLLLDPAATRVAAAEDHQRIAGVDTSQWRGFNLLEKFTLRGNAPFQEDDFKWIAELGFNFVRLPMDYRCYTEPGDWLKFKESALQEIDQAIAFGEKYGIHVCLNLHRAPGFCINPPAEPKNLWTDPEAQEAFLAHWTMFARRYRHVPAARLSFNLINEPTRNTRETFLHVNQRAITAIHAVDAQRLVIVDGNNVGSVTLPEFVPLANVIQATRGYHPSNISHYRASWMKGSDTWPEPVWPPLRLTGHLYGPSKPELKSPLVLRGEFPTATEISLKFVQLSSRASVVARVDGMIAREAIYDPKPSPADWKPVKSDGPWVYHEPTKELQFAFTLPSAAKEIVIEAFDGDWIRFAEISVQPPGSDRRISRADPTWGRRQSVHLVTPQGHLLAPAGTDPNQALVEYLKPWRAIAAQGETVFVGEWGCYNKTPHAVALAWMDCWLAQWREARFGWALWNFRGAFGILDSGRTDVQYEDWHGHKLDREMLRLLQRQ